MFKLIRDQFGKFAGFEGIDGISHELLDAMLDKVLIYDTKLAEIEGMKSNNMAKNVENISNVFYTLFNISDCKNENDIKYSDVDLSDSFGGCFGTKPVSSKEEAVNG